MRLGGPVVLTLNKFKPFETSRDTLISLRPKAGTTTSYGTVDKKGKVKTYLSEACIHKLQFCPENFKDVSSLFIWNVADKGDKRSNDYLNYITSLDTSPWRDLLRRQPVQEPSFIHDYGYVLSDLDCPSNLVTNFLVAFRFPSEYSKTRLEAYTKLRHDGASFGSSMAVLDLAQTWMNNESVLYNGSSHYPFTTAHTGWGISDRINRCEPNEKFFHKNTFSSNTYSLPMNVLWQEDTGPDNTALSKLEAFVKEYKTPESKNLRQRMFPDPPTYSYSEGGKITYPALLEFCRKLDRKEVI